MLLICVVGIPPVPASAASITFSGSASATGTSWVTHPFTVDATGTVTAVLDWDNTASDLNLFLVAPDGSYPASSTSTTAKPETVTTEATQLGTWKVAVKAKTGDANYTIALTYPTAGSATVGDRVWDDVNGNGIQDTTETVGVSGVTVRLHDAATSTLVATSLTSVSGGYSFSGLSPGTAYYVVFAPGPDYGLSPANQGGNDAVDSDADPVTGSTSSFTLAVGENRTTIDAGVASKPATTTTFTGDIGGGRVTHPYQVAKPGRIDAALTWTGSADLNLYLYDPAGTLVASATSSTAHPEIVSHNAESPGTWTFAIKAKRGKATYQLDVSFTASADPVITPRYSHTIGGPGHAEMYPSGLDVDGLGTSYLADTGNDKVKAYRSDGTLLWEVGTRGIRALGSFDNPRDVAYLEGKVYVGDTGFSRVQVLDAADGAVLGEWSYRFGTIMGISAGVDEGGASVVLVTVDNLHAVQVFTPTGTLVRTIGSGPGSGDGQLRFPRDAATDSAGRVYVADYENNRISRFSATGTWLSSWGTGGTGSGQFKQPYGVDTDAADNVYVADSNNGRIQSFTSSGAYLAQWGSPGEGPEEFFHLRRVAVASGAAPEVYGADLWGNKLIRFRAEGAVDRIFGGTDAQLGGFNEPYGVAVDDQSVFVADTTNQRAQRFGLSGAFELSWGIRGFGAGPLGMNWPRDIVLSATTGTVWVADTKNFRLREFSRDGVATGRSLGSKGSGIGQMNWPHALDDYGDDLIVADTWNSRIQRWDPETGTVVWTATGFNYPKDVTVSSGVIYVADTLNKRVVKLSPLDGSVLGTLTSSALHHLEGIAVEPNGDLWIADTSWNRLVELAADGSFLQTYGTTGSAYNQFDRPAHLEIQVSGPDRFLYVADMWNERIQIFEVS